MRGKRSVRKLRRNTTRWETAKALAMVEETTIGSLLFHDIENGLRIQIEL